MDAALSNGDTHYAAWKCEDGNLYIDTFRPAQFLPLVAQIVAGIKTIQQVIDEAASWPRTSKAEADTLKRKVMVNHYGAQPVVLTPVAYRRRTNINQPAAFVRYGSVPVGTPCEKGGKYGELMLIDRAKVVKDSSISVQPPEAYASCG